MKIIRLSKGHHAIVDDSDYEFLNQWKWSACKSWWTETVYAARKPFGGKNGKSIYMHRLIMGEPQGLEVDHKDRNGLNNQRTNLRIAEKFQNRSNQGLSKMSVSRAKGVRQKGRSWEAHISVGDKYVYLGIFKTFQDALDAYDRAAISNRGEFAVTNKELGIS